MNRILTLDEFKPVASPTEQLLRDSWPFWLAPFRLPEGVASGVTAAAEVNHGRWIVYCPAPGCNGAQMASYREKRFFCVDCLHAALPAAQGKWIAVEWPKNKEEIDSILAPRKEHNRNWQAGEDVKQLRIENAALLSDKHLGDLVDSMGPTEDQLAHLKGKN